MKSRSKKLGIAKLTRDSEDRRLYVSLASSLARDIVKGSYPSGHKLPSEKALTEAHSVSRHTVRQALRLLREQGLIASRMGVGTVVHQRAVTPKAFTAIRNGSDLRDSFLRTKLRMVSLHSHQADKQLAAMMECKMGSVVAELCYLRSTPSVEQPHGLTRVYVSGEYASALIVPDVFEMPVYQNMERMFGFVFCQASEEKSAIALDRELAQVLQVPPGEPALRIVRRYRDARMKLLLCSVSYHPSSRYSEQFNFSL